MNAFKYEDKVRQMCVDTNAISKNLAFLLHRTPNNAQNTLQKLGVVFSYLEHKELFPI